MPKHLILTLLAAVLPLGAGCGGGGGGGTSPADPDPTPDTSPDTGFAYETSNEISAKILVQRDGEPLAHAVVQVVSALTPPGPGELIEDRIEGELYFHGATDASGWFEAQLTLPTSVERVDVIVNDPTARGPYTFPELKALWGPFAPSARVAAAPADLEHLSLELWSR